MKTRLLSLILAATLLVGFGACSTEPSSPPTQSAATSALAHSQRSTAESTVSTSTASAVEQPRAPTIALQVLSAQLSEKGADFFSDNFISNETSYLQIAPALRARGRRGGAYIGAGPEQNFTYIALTEPDVAFIVDIRRDNLVEQLLYKAIFELAKDRSQFLTLLTGRAYQADSAPASDASLDDVLAHAGKSPADAQQFERIHTELLAHIEKRWGAPLDAADEKTLRRTHQAFFEPGLDIRFVLRDGPGRRYPSLRELLGASDPEGHKSGFLADEKSFRLLQRMEREDRIVPVVGDFAGDKAVKAIGDETRRRGLTVSAFYVSNVEQYLFENGVWKNWVDNIASLPTDADSLFVRCYLDQGKRHPLQMAGHRTATTLQRMSDFLARNRRKAYTSLWGVSSDDTNFVTFGPVASAVASAAP